MGKEKKPDESNRLKLMFRSASGKDRHIQFRVQEIANGYTLKAGASPVFYSTLPELADSLRAALLTIDEENPTTPGARDAAGAE